MSIPTRVVYCYCCANFSFSFGSKMKRVCACQCICLCVFFSFFHFPCFPSSSTIRILYSYYVNFVCCRCVVGSLTASTLQPISIGWCCRKWEAQRKERRKNAKRNKESDRWCVILCCLVAFIESVCVWYQLNQIKSYWNEEHNFFLVSSSLLLLLMFLFYIWRH